MYLTFIGITHFHSIETPTKFLNYKINAKRSLRKHFDRVHQQIVVKIFLAPQQHPHMHVFLLTKFPYFYLHVHVTQIRMPGRSPGLLNSYWSARVPLCGEEGSDHVLSFIELCKFLLILVIDVLKILNLLDSYSFFFGELLQVRDQLKDCVFTYAVELMEIGGNASEVPPAVGRRKKVPVRQGWSLVEGGYFEPAVEEGSGLVLGSVWDCDAGLEGGVDQQLVGSCLGYGGNGVRLFVNGEDRRQCFSCHNGLLASLTRFYL